MYIDWVGDQPELLTDPATGEIHKVHVFATTLGFSSRVYAEVFLDEKLPSFITGVVHALEYYGAVPKYLVPDNLKTAISKHSKDELILNSAFFRSGGFLQYDCAASTAAQAERETDDRKPRPFFGDTFNRALKRKHIYKSRFPEQRNPKDNSGNQSSGFPE